jgi:hypothetical protein
MVQVFLGERHRQGTEWVGVRLDEEARLQLIASRRSTRRSTAEASSITLGG